VDHVWVLGEDDQTTVRDYPGNYSQYRALRTEEMQRKQAAQTATKQAATSTKDVAIKGDYTTRLSYKERLEFETLETSLPQLEAKRDELQAALLNETDHVQMQSLGEALGRVTQDLEDAEMRWLELSERA
jgi:ATP-binding cassette subfamily F protein uup